METVTWNDCYRPKLPQSIFDPWSCTGTLWIWDKVPINTTLHSPHICDIQAPRTTQPWTDMRGYDNIINYLVTKLATPRLEGVQHYADLKGHQVNGGTIPPDVAMTGQ